MMVLGLNEPIWGGRPKKSKTGIKEKKMIIYDEVKPPGDGQGGQAGVGGGTLGGSLREGGGGDKSSRGGGGGGGAHT